MRLFPRDNYVHIRTKENRPGLRLSEQLFAWSVPGLRLLVHRVSVCWCDCFYTITTSTFVRRKIDPVSVCWCTRFLAILVTTSTFVQRKTDPGLRLFRVSREILKDSLCSSFPSKSKVEACGEENFFPTYSALEPRDRPQGNNCYK